MLITKLNNPGKFEPYFWGGGIGFFSGLIGVGGGIFLSPIILLKRWATVKSAATAAVFIFVNSLSGLVGMGVSNQLNLDYSLLAIFVIAIIIGGYLGSLYGAKYADNNRVRNMLAVVLIIAAGKRFLELL